ncbi:CoA-transferase [Microbacterium sp. BWT-B31]|uniref:CoA transferase subunit A n=1 Tax=Microbacterium sp. BWT-B31 TaxID=3232072 RepID=UPI003528C7B4
MKSKVCSLAEAIGLVHDGDTVALGGHTLRRHPMAAVAELIRQKRRDLHLLGWNSGIDFDLLTAGGCVSIAETSYVGISGFGLGRNFRRAVQGGEIEVREHSEISALDMFRAGSMGVPFIASHVLRGTDVPATNPRFSTVVDPFTGQELTAVQAAQPDVAIIHAHTADIWGNVQLDPLHWPDNDADEFIGWAGRTTIVTVEQLVTDEQIRRNPERTILPRDAVTCVVEAPYGAYPCACDSRYTYDLGWVEDYYEASADPTAFARFVEDWVTGVEDHQAFLDRLGVDRLLSVSKRGGVL